MLAISMPQFFNTLITLVGIDFNF